MKRFGSRELRYLMATVAVAAAILLFKILVVLHGGGTSVYSALFPAVMVASLFGGLGPGLFATFLGAAAVDYFFLSPGGFGITSTDDLIGMVYFCSTGALIGVIGHLYRTERDRSALRDRESVLRDAYEKMRVFADSTHDWAYWRGPDNTMLHVSPSCERITGYAPDEFVRDADLCLRIVHPDDRETVTASISRTTIGSPPRELEYRISRKDGTERWLGQVCHPVVDSDGHCKGWRVSCRDITDRKKMETALRVFGEELQAADSALLESRSEVIKTAGEAVVARRMADAASVELLSERDLTAAVLDNVGALVVVLDRDGRITRFNKACERCTGYRAEQVRGEVFWKLLVPPEEMVGIEPKWEALKAGRFPIEHENHWIARDGTRHLIAWTNTALTGADGTVEYIIGTGLDITERRKVEGELAGLENSYSNLFNNMAEGFALHEMLCGANGDPVDYRFIEVNPAYERMTGLRREQLVGRRASEVEKGGILSRVKAYGAVAMTGTPCRFEETNPETSRCFEVHVYSPVRQQFALILTDITEVVRIREREQEVLATLTAARTAGDAVDAMGEGVLVTDGRGVIRMVNKAMTCLSGYSREEVVGKALVEVLSLVLRGDELASASSDLNSVMHDEPVPTRTLSLVAKDGRRIPVVPAASLIRSTGGRKDGLVLSLRDMSALLASQIAVADSERKYRERLRALAEKLATTEERERWRISRHIHDTIAQNLSLASVRLGTLHDEVADAKSGDSVRQLGEIRGLVNEAIGECRTVMADLTPSLLYEFGLVAALDELAKGMSERHGVDITVVGNDEEDSMPDALRGLLFESTRELIMNAVKHAGKCEIQVCVRRHESRIVILVSDNGVGFDPDKMENTLERKGGVGLFSVRQRVEGLGGRIVVESAPGEGTVVSINLPFKETPAADGMAHPAREENCPRREGGTGHEYSGG